MTATKDPLAPYLQDLLETGKRGDAREESFYPCLKTLLEEYARSAGLKGIHVTSSPSKTEAGNPDFRVWNGNDKITGYIEAKAPTQEDLAALESTSQIKRYLETFPNFILTNFLEFRLYRDGRRIDTVLAARPFILTRLKTAPPPEKGPELLKLLDKFLSFSLPKKFTAESLAVELAKRARFLRDAATDQLRLEQETGGPLTGFYEAFHKYLISDLTQEDFADLYAQTVTYGLFAARTRAKDGFSRRKAFDHIPRTIGILRDVFRYISLEDPPPPIQWIVDDIAEVLSTADAGGILDRYYRDGKGSDPIVHFYETFLAEYDPKERERRGVYYTPEPVVSYIVRSLHALLKKSFDRRDGLASEGLTLLDPAAGTMTFVAKACQEAVLEFERRYGKGAREGFIRDHLLKNFYAFELMMAPYAVGHLKMSFFLKELGHRLGDDERFLFYLTNTLEMQDLGQTQMPGIASLAEESRLAGDVKKNRPILVILGNPPYSGHSSNKGEWIVELVEDYKRVDGKPLGEKNPKWLQDDYVKFLRFAQWKIDQTGEGLVGMITNHSWLDNPTFRGMRRSLMNSFDEIYLLNLHGNSLKRETTPKGGKDENVFDIRQGVVIVFLIKKGKEGPKKIYYADLWGRRDEKYDWLSANDVHSTPWQEIKPNLEHYLFIPRDEASYARYDSFIPITEIFPVHSVGIVTARDSLTIHWTPEEAWEEVRRFAHMDPELARQAYQLGEDAKDWKIKWAQKDLRNSGPSKEKIVPVLYRPFDIRYTYYTGNSSGFHCRPRPEVMRHMLMAKNIALISARSNKSREMDHFFISTMITEAKCGESTTQSCLFPLKNCPDPEDLFGAAGLSEQYNLNTNVVAALVTRYKCAPAPEDIFHYVYATLHAKSYRERYTEFLRIDFPRIPFTADFGLFRTLASLGKRLVDLHLLRSAELDSPGIRFQGNGDNLLGGRGDEGLTYDTKKQRIWINAAQHFEPVSPELWECRIGGYQVLEKWLKDRRGRKLALEQIKTYCRIAAALRKTLEIQKEIDPLYRKVEQEITPI